MFVYPEIDPVVVHIVGPLAVRWYGITYLVGFVAAWYLAKRRTLRPDAPIAGAQVDDLIFFAALGVILGGRIGSMLFYNFDQLADSPLSLFRIWDGGMSFHGGLLGVIAAMWIYARWQKVGFFRLADFVAPLVPIGLGAGRIGNFINGELWGAPTTVPWAFIVDGEARHASQLYEAALEGLALFVIVWLFSAKPRPTMSVAGLFLLGYGVFRFAVEFVRLPDQQLGYLAFGWLTMGQVLTLPMFVGGCVLLWLAYRRQSASVAAGR